MRNKILFLVAVAVISFISLFSASRSNAQFSGIISEETWFGRCIRQATNDIERQRCAKTNEGRTSTPIPTPNASPTASSDSSSTAVRNPFLPSTAANPNTCRNRSFHIPPSVTEAKDDPSKGVLFNRFESLRAEPQAMFDGDVKTSGLFGRADDSQTETDDAYIAAILTKRQALTYMSIRWKAEPANQGVAISGGYLLYTGFFDDTNKKDIVLDPPCFLGELINVPLTGETQIYELADAGTQAPIKADYILIKRAPLATPNVASIAEIAFGGVDPDSGQPNPATALKGKVYLTGKTSFTLSNAKIYDETEGNDNKKLIATTNANGTYISSDLSAVAGRRKLLVERDGFNPRRETVTIKNGKATEKNFPISFASVNAIHGTVTYAAGRPIKDHTVLAYEGDRVVSVARTDSQGKYRIEVAQDGEYRVQPIANRSLIKPTFSADRATVTFEQQRGQTRQRNFKTKEANSTGNATLNLSVVEQITYMTSGARIKGANVLIFSESTNTVSFVGVWDDKPKILPAGTYVITAAAQGYENGKTTITLKPGEKSEMLDLRLEPTGTNCLKKPQSFLTEFWFCGTRANEIASNPAYQNKYKAIDTTVKDINQRFGIKNVPQRFVIIPSNAVNGFFFSPIYSDKGNVGNSSGNQAIEVANVTPSSNPCPPPFDSSRPLLHTTLFHRDPKDGDMIMLTTAKIEQSTEEEIERAMIHELGHNLDYRKGGCKDYRSEKDDFIKYRQMAVMFANEKFGKDKVGEPSWLGKLHGETEVTRGSATLFSALADKNYNPPNGQGGHPEDNVKETFASIFVGNVVYPDKFAKYASTEPEENPVSGPLVPRHLSPDIGRVLQEMAKIVMDPKI